MNFDRVEFRPFYNPRFHPEPACMGACINGEIYTVAMGGPDFITTLTHEAGHVFTGIEGVSIESCLQPQELRGTRIELPKEGKSTHQYTTWFPDIPLHRVGERRSPRGR
jgi:hypothetical protein